MFTLTLNVAELAYLLDVLEYATLQELFDDCEEIEQSLRDKIETAYQASRSN